jgi:YegS/Rv2252/BmrU family lipid kinase
VLRSRFSNLQARLTTARGDAERIAAEFAASHSRGLLIAVGGDGSIHEIGNGLVDAGYAGTLAIVPAGTGNDIARNLGIPTDPARALLMDPAEARPVDLAQVSLENPAGEPRHRWFLNSLSIGASARANRIALSMGRMIRGPAKYPIAGVLALFSSNPERYEVLLGGRRHFHGRALNLTIANGPGFGGGLRISPDSRPDDGRLELVMIGEMRRVRALAALRALRTGAHVTMPEVEVIPAANLPIEIRGERALAFEADGENLVASERLIVNLQPGRLRVAR